jgi:hypothetical protein
LLAASAATQTVPSPMSSMLTFPSSSHSGTLPGTANNSSLTPGRGSNCSPSRTARRYVAVDDVEHAIGADRIQRRLRAKQDKRLAFAQRQKSSRGIDLGVGENNRADWRMAPRALGVQRRRRQDLLTQIDRGVEQEPI